MKGVSFQIPFYIVLSLLWFSSVGQSNLSQRADNFNPNLGLTINPANAVNAKPWIDIHIAGTEVFVENNYLFYPNTTLLNFSSFELEPDQNTSNSHADGYLENRVDGPGITFAFDRLAFSFFTAGRVIANASHIPYPLIRSATEEGILPSDSGWYDLLNTRIKALAWTEIGVSLGAFLRARETTLITGGLSLKYLQGVQHSSLYIPEGQVLVVNPDSLLFLTDQASYAFTEPSQNVGTGLGLDLGLTFYKMKENVSHYVPHSNISYCKSVDYKYKLGLSLLDLGYVRMNNAYFGTLETIQVIDTANSAEDLYEKAKLEAQGNQYSVLTPLAISAQVDFNVNNKIYLNGTIIQRFPQKRTRGVERVNSLSISARYESKWFGISIPITLYGYSKPLIGLTARLGYLLIGTDQLLPFLMKQDIYSANFYIHLKIPIHSKPACRSKKHKEKKETYRTHECATWN
jgi:hypothetical protein